MKSASHSLRFDTCPRNGCKLDKVREILFTLVTRPFRMLHGVLLQASDDVQISERATEGVHIVFPVAADVGN